jgi:cytochrome c-type biogenesis protein CcmH/NrfF
MALKFDIYHRDYLFWIYPLIILGLIIFAVIQDKHKRESIVSVNAIFNKDSTLTNNLQDSEVDRLKMIEYIDSTMIFYTTTK